MDELVAVEVFTVVAVELFAFTEVPVTVCVWVLVKTSVENVVDVEEVVEVVDAVEVVESVAVDVPVLLEVSDVPGAAGIQPASIDDAKSSDVIVLKFMPIFVQGRILAID